MTRIETFRKKLEVVPHINLAEDHYVGENCKHSLIRSGRFGELIHGEDWKKRAETLTGFIWKLLYTKSGRECHSFSNDYAKPGLEFHQIEDIEAYGLRVETSKPRCTLKNYFPWSSLHSSPLLTPLGGTCPLTSSASLSSSSSNAVGSARGWDSGSGPAAFTLCDPCSCTPSSADTEMPLGPHPRAPGFGRAPAPSLWPPNAGAPSSSKSPLFRPTMRLMSQPRLRSSESTTPPCRSFTRCLVQYTHAKSMINAVWMVPKVQDVGSL